MIAVEPSPEQTLAVFLGASEFQCAPNLAHGAAFYNSAQGFREYLTAPSGLGLPFENILWLFDDRRDASVQLQDVRNFLKRRSREFSSSQAPAKDLIIYYVGHGLFSSPDQAYCLAIHSLDEESPGLTSIRASDLATVIKTHARVLRTFLILDCCFSAAAHKDFQSAPLLVGRAKLLHELPPYGTTLLCSASAQDASLAPKGLSRTMFSEVLLKTLRQGSPALGPRLSISEIGDLVKLNLRGAFPDNWVRPEVHSPDQREGDVASVGLFPNPAHAVQSMESQSESTASARHAEEIPTKGQELLQELPQKRDGQASRASQQEATKASEVGPKEVGAGNSLFGDPRGPDIEVQAPARPPKSVKKLASVIILSVFLCCGIVLLSVSLKTKKHQLVQQPSLTANHLGILWTNSLGMPFVRVPQTEVLFCIWETRVRDYRTFEHDSPNNGGYDYSKGEQPYILMADGWKQRGTRFGWDAPGFHQDNSCPVTCVSWDDAVSFCRWLTAKERRENRLRLDQEYRLPTDAEWSLSACLTEPISGTPKEKDERVIGLYPWGEIWPPPQNAGNFAGREAKELNWQASLPTINGYVDGYARTAPVGSFPTNRLGIHDLSGNVWEWCDDAYDTNGPNRVARGGSWSDGESRYLLSSYRSFHLPSYRADNYGFRCVLVASGSAR